MSYTDNGFTIKWLERNFMLGREAASDLVADFFYDWLDQKLKARKIEAVDVGDPPDIILGRIGPDNAPWDTPRGDMARVGPNQPLGAVGWRAFVGETDDPPGVGFNGKNCEIVGRAAGEQTPTSNGGSLEINTTPIGSTETVTRMRVEHDGTISFPGVPTVYRNGAAHLRVRAENGQIFELRLG